MKHDLNYGDKDKKSIRYQFIKELYSRYQLQGFAQDYTQAHDSQGSTGSGLNGDISRSSTQQYIFLPSDPDELVDQLKLLYFEKVGGNDSFLINEQIIAIIDKLLEYECISPSQHQNTHSNLISSQSPSITLRISLWIKDLIIWIRFITNPVPTPIFIFQSVY